MKKFEYNAIIPHQSASYSVCTFCAPASEILQFATIDRISRDQKGAVKGFQRPQVSKHIQQIRDYLDKDEAILPNAIVVAFLSDARIIEREQRTGFITIDVKDDIPGFVVDGQQRLTALSDLPEKDFEVYVSAVICDTEEELRKQFILINNTRPLPKQLIYELLPSVSGLPHALQSRSVAASIVEELNYNEESSLKGQIKQHTNPEGVLQDTTFQKVIMNSLKDGCMRQLSENGDNLDACFTILSEFFGAVQIVFEESWKDQKPKTSRLVHSAGIMSMGYVLEYIHATNGATSRNEFAPVLEKIKPFTAWTTGTWEFGDDNKRPWNSLQFVPRDYTELTQHLIRQLKRVAWS